MNSHGKEDGWLLWDRNILISKLEKTAVYLIRCQHLIKSIIDEFHRALMKKWKCKIHFLTYKMVFSTCFSEHLCMASPCVSKLKPSVNLTRRWNIESPWMIAAIVRLLLMFTLLRKYPVGDIVLSLTRLKKHVSELKFFVSIFRKFDQINE